MKRLSYLFLLAAGMFLILYPAGSAVAEDHATIEISDDVSMTVSGSIRTRFEWTENYNFSDADDDAGGMVPSRFRLGLRFDLPADIAAVFEMQSLQTWGEGTSYRGDQFFLNAPIAVGGFVPTGVSSDDDFSLYQGYVEVNEIGGSLLDLNIGRQEFSYGTEFLLGDNDFYGGLTLDGIKGIWNFSNDSTLDIFYAKVDEQTRAYPGHDEDTDMYGFYFNWPELGGYDLGLDAYLIGTRSGIGVVPGSGESTLNMWTLGVRVFHAMEYGLHYNAELAFQTGDITDGGVELDVDAMAFEGSIGYTFDIGGNPDIHLGFTTASGDDDPTDGDWEAFNPLFQDFHARNGLADIVATSDIQIIQLGYAGSFENHSWGVDLYDFELDEAGIYGDSLAQEIDFHYSYQYSDNLAVNFVYALVMADDVIEGTMGDDDLQRVYANLVVSF